MLAEIQIGLFLIGHQRLPERLPVEYINTHGSQIAAGMRGLLLKVHDSSVLVSDHDPETARLFLRDRHDSDSYFCIVFLMEIQHRFVIHLIDMITGQNKHIIGVVALHICEILIDCVRGSRVPVRVRDLLIRRQYRDSSHILIEVPRDSDPDVRIQPQRHILCQYSYSIHT